MANPVRRVAISGQVLAGGSGFSGVTVCLSGKTSAGTGISQSVTTDANGDYYFSVPAGGNYTVTPTLSGYAFSPGFYEFQDLSVNQIADFAQASSPTSDDWNGFWGLPLQSSATPSGTGCGDISGAWTEGSSPGANWQLSQNGNTVTGTVTSSNGPSCGNVTWQVTGQLQEANTGQFYVTATNPSPSVDGCGIPASTQISETLTINPSTSCSSGDADVSSQGNYFQTPWSSKQRPTSLSVVNVHVYTYAEEVAAGYPPSCAGIVIGVTYQLLDQNKVALQVAGLVPQEQVLNATVNRIPMGNAESDYVDIVKGMTTNAKGQFTDAPFGACNAPTPSTQAMSDVQNIRIVNPKKAGSWVVRTNNWSYTLTSAGHGSVTNGVDVSAQH